MAEVVERRAGDLGTVIADASKAASANLRFRFVHISVDESGHVDSVVQAKADFGWQTKRGLKVTAKRRAVSAGLEA